MSCLLLYFMSLQMQFSVKESGNSFLLSNDNLMSKCGSFISNMIKSCSVYIFTDKVLFEIDSILIFEKQVWLDCKVSNISGNDIVFTELDLASIARSSTIRNSRNKELMLPIHEYRVHFAEQINFIYLEPKKSFKYSIDITFANRLPFFVDDKQLIENNYKQLSYCSRFVADCNSTNLPVYPRNKKCLILGCGVTECQYFKSATRQIDYYFIRR